MKKMTLRIVFASAALAVFWVGCSSTSEDTTGAQGTSDGGSSASAGKGGAGGGKAGSSGQPSGSGGAAGGGAAAGGAGGASSGCVIDADCTKSLPPTSPPGCAAASCDPVAKLCKFHPKDADGDGHYATGCTGTGVAPGDDCDDGDPKAHPGAWDGPAGKDAAGVQQTASCDTKDTNCNGKVDDGTLPDGSSCACKVGATQKCDVDAKGKTIVFPTGSWPAGTPAPGSSCTQGLQTCVDTNGVGAWGPCSGAVGPAPRDCSSSKDADCDGKPDNTHDTVCTCTPNDPTACMGNPKFPKSTCQGTRKCQVAADKASSAWSDCDAPEFCTCSAGTTQACKVGACTGQQSCGGGQWGPCDSPKGAVIPSTCECIPGDTKKCGGAACTTTLTCGSDFKWPACPAPDNCNCPAPGATQACSAGSCPGATMTCGPNYQWGGCSLPGNCECLSGQSTPCSAIGKGACGTASCGGNNLWDAGGCYGTTHYCNDNDMDGHGADGSGAMDACGNPGGNYVTACDDQCETIKGRLSPGCPSENGWWNDVGGQCAMSADLGTSGDHADSGSTADIWGFITPSGYKNEASWEIHFDAIYGGGGCYSSGTTAIHMHCQSGQALDMSEVNSGCPSKQATHYDAGGTGYSCDFDQTESWTPFAQGTCHRQLVNVSMVGYIPYGCWP